MESRRTRGPIAGWQPILRRPVLLAAGLLALLATHTAGAVDGQSGEAGQIAAEAAAVPASRSGGPALVSHQTRETMAARGFTTEARIARTATRPGAPAVAARTVPPTAELPPVGSAPPQRPISHFAGLQAEAVDHFDFDSLPGRLSDPSLHDRWYRGLDFERRDMLLESAHEYELIVSEVPEEAYTYWRIARNYWRHGESIGAREEDPSEEIKAERLRYFELAEDWAARGLSIDAECAPCMLWKFVSMGRQATTKGLLSAMKDAREMDRLLRRGIELKPTHQDFEGNNTLGNLYYAGSVFYRVVPDWFWLRWVAGVRGNKERSLAYARRAVELAGVRVDYRVELGASLLCYGTSKMKPEAIVEGVEVLEEAQALDDYLSTDYLDKSHAKVMIEDPGKACGYSRDGFIDVDEVMEKAR